MASGKDHERASMILAPATAVPVLLVSMDPLTAVVAGAGCWAGRYLSPDLDMAQVTISERRVMQKSGIVGWLFFAYWWPYGRIIPHRSPLSHWPIIGTLGRLLYIFAPLLLVGALFDWEWLVGFVGTAVMSRYFAAFISGLVVSDTAHFIMDTWLWRELSSIGRSVAYILRGGHR